MGGRVGNSVCVPGHTSHTIPTHVLHTMHRVLSLLVYMVGYVRFFCPCLVESVAQAGIFFFLNLFNQCSVELSLEPHYSTHKCKRY